MRYTSWWFCLTIPMSILLSLDLPTIQEAIDAAAPGDELRQF